MKRHLVMGILAFLTACAGGATETVVVQPSLTISPTRSHTASSTSTSEPTIMPTANPTPDPAMWQSWPIVPEDISSRMKEIYLQGQELGLDPHAYSKFGDCEASPSWYLSAFDGKPQDYSLGEYVYLQEVIDHFKGSHSRDSLAAGNGFSTASILANFMADRSFCEADESPLLCEIRIQRPSIALVSLGTNDAYNKEGFITNMRQILETLIASGVVPILASKADNLEGDHSINLELAKFALEYELPFWNFWLAVQPLPNHGLQEDGAHLVWAGPFFDDPARMLASWPWRNLTALQSLDAVWRALDSGD